MFFLGGALSICVPLWNAPPTESPGIIGELDELDAGPPQDLFDELIPGPYERLRAALLRYEGQKEEGGWPRIPNGLPLKKGDDDVRVAVLKKRLNAESRFNRPLTESSFFDEHLEKTLSQTQERYGLEKSGILDDETTRVLNVPLDERIRQIQINMERCGQLPSDMGGEHILVNAADFKLSVVKRGKVIMGMKVIVGKPYRRTPVFNSRVLSVILNPSWNVPRKVAVDVVLPLAQKNPRYLADNHFIVFQDYKENSPKVDPLSVDWRAVTPENFTYRFLQLAGASNALGSIKFDFPNAYAVYLHDTPSRDLFKQPLRAFSAGCIRAERPLDLAVFLLRDQPRWTRPALEKAIRDGNSLSIPLSKPYPIYVAYLTAWAELDGNIQFRKDVYGRD